MLVGNILDHFELLNLEKLPFEELLMKVKEQARMKKLDKYVSKGRPNVAVGRQQGNGQAGGHKLHTFGGQEEENTNIKESQLQQSQSDLLNIQEHLDFSKEKDSYIKGNMKESLANQVNEYLMESMDNVLLDPNTEIKASEMKDSYQNLK